MRVSICIPSYNRPDLLRECLQSCISQTRPPFEILVGDDSTTRIGETEAVVKEMAEKAPCPIHYWKNNPRRLQGGNIHDCFQRAQGDLICLIHDDDKLTERTLEVLVPPFDDPTVGVAYGKQYVINHEGEIDEHRTMAGVRGFFKTPEYAGRQDDMLLAAILQQFPNNGYVIRAELAKAVGYLDAERHMGDGCDQGFAVFCALKRPDLKPYFADEFTACYRLSRFSAGRGHRDCDTAYRTVKYISRMKHDILKHPQVDAWLRTRIGVAINQAVRHSDMRFAWEIFWSRWHRGEILTPRGLARLGRIVTGCIRVQWMTLLGRTPERPRAFG
jgi:glycosyltransferase involved in cell wall biosynthesis